MRMASLEHGLRGWLTSSTVPGADEVGDPDLVLEEALYREVLAEVAEG